MKWTLQLETYYTQSHTYTRNFINCNQMFFNYHLFKKKKKNSEFH